MRIYQLECEGLCLYVGQTVKSLVDRARRHRWQGNEATSRYIPKDCEWTIQLLEECPDEQGTAREQYYYDTLKPLYNIQRPGQTPEESVRHSRARNPGAKKEYDRLYKARNRVILNERRRLYRARKKAQALVDATVVGTDAGETLVPPA